MPRSSSLTSRVGISAIGGIASAQVLLEIKNRTSTNRTAGAKMARIKHQDLLVGLIRLHILNHAAKEEFYGQWMIRELSLSLHGYSLSAGTLYPMLHALERRGYLKSRKERLGRIYRRIYRATACSVPAAR